MKKHNLNILTLYPEEFLLASHILIISISITHPVHHVTVFYQYKKLYIKGYSHKQPQVRDIRNFKFHLQRANKCTWVLPPDWFPMLKDFSPPEALSNHTQGLEGVVALTCPRLLFIHGANQQQHKKNPHTRMQQLLSEGSYWTTVTFFTLRDNRILDGVHDC